MFVCFGHSGTSYRYLIPVVHWKCRKRRCIPNVSSRRTRITLVSFITGFCCCTRQCGISSYVLTMARLHSACRWNGFVFIFYLYRCGRVQSDILGLFFWTSFCFYSPTSVTRAKLNRNSALAAPRNAISASLWRRWTKEYKNLREITSNIDFHPKLWTWSKCFSWKKWVCAAAIKKINRK